MKSESRSKKPEAQADYQEMGQDTGNRTGSQLSKSSYEVEKMGRIEKSKTSFTVSCVIL